MCQNSAERLRSPPVVIVEHPAQPFMAHNGGMHLDRAVPFLDQLIVEPLVIALGVVVRRVLLHSVA